MIRYRAFGTAPMMNGPWGHHPLIPLVTGSFLGAMKYQRGGGSARDRYRAWMDDATLKASMALEGASIEY